MRQVIIAEFITLDGVIQAPGGADEDTEGGFANVEASPLPTGVVYMRYRRAS